MVDKVIMEARLIWRLLLDGRVSLWMKLIPAAAVLYVLSPVDFIPDVIIGLGQLDDLGILLGGLRLFKSMVPAYIIEEHQQMIEGAVIEVRDYKVHDREPDER